MLSRKRGFSLLELIVVIVIIGVLSLLAIPSFRSVLERSRDQAVQTTAASFGRNVVAVAGFDAGEAGNAGEVRQSHVVALGASGGDNFELPSGFTLANLTTGNAAAAADADGQVYAVTGNPGVGRFVIVQDGTVAGIDAGDRCAIVALADPDGSNSSVSTTVGTIQETTPGSGVIAADGTAGTLCA